LFPEYFARTGCRLAFWVTDVHVVEHWKEQIETLRDPTTELMVLPPGEDQKRLSTVEDLCRRLVSMGAERGDAIVACGGGVIGDMVGLAAALYQRGIVFIQIPTTLLAMVDASVGGKTGVDLPEGKNLVGVFHQPAFVLADTEFLNTLPQRELHSGMAEVIKMALIGEPELFAHLVKISEHGYDIFENSSYLIERCVNLKSLIVAQDEREKGRRAVLNFGHTIGHALEAWGGYQTLTHGEAVFWGMVAAIDLSRDLGLLDSAVADHIMTVIQPQLKPIPKLKFQSEQILELMARDKKTRSGRPEFVLLRGVGNAVIGQPLAESDILAALQRLRLIMRS
jgi:3-dehydroquinate synthase